MLETRIPELKQMLMSEAGLVEKMASLSVDGLYKNYPIFAGKCPGSGRPGEPEQNWRLMINV